MTRFLLSVSALLALSAGSVLASPIATDGTWYTFGFGLATSAAYSGVGATTSVNPTSQVAPDPAWTFTGPATFQVLDEYFAGDRFEVFDSGTSLGTTSAPGQSGSCLNDIACALADSNFSRGSFTLGIGSHSITINVIQNATDTSRGAAVFSATATPPASTPEPGTLLILGGGLCAAALLRRRA